MKKMIDVVIPKDNEKEFVLIAGKLGYDSLLFLYDYSNYLLKQKEFENEKNKIKIFIGILADEKDMDRIKNKFKGKKILIAIKSSNNSREVIEKSKANLIFSFEDSNRRDFIHHRASGLNHIMCKLAHQKNITIGFSLSSILNSKNRPQTLGRMMQNIKLCRKYKVKTIIASFASNPFEMRSSKDVETLFTNFGMQQKEVKDSMSKNIF